MATSLCFLAHFPHTFQPPPPSIHPTPSLSHSCRAKRALASVLPKEKIAVLELDEVPDSNAIQDYLLSITGGRSVPRVFIDGEFIGGGDDTDALARSGKLEIMLREKGII